MGMWGYSYPKIKYGTTEYNLGKSLVETNFGETNIVIQQSIINGRRHFVKKSDPLATIRITMNLFKYDDPAVKFEELKVLQHATVKLKLHVDGANYLIDVYDNEADFFVTQFTPYYLKTTTPHDYRDKLFIELQSAWPLNLVESMYGYLIDGSGNFLVDGSGNMLRGRAGSIFAGDEETGDFYSINIAETIYIGEVPDQEYIWFKQLNAEASDTISLTDYVWQVDIK